MHGDIWFFSEHISDLILRKKYLFLPKIDKIITDKFLDVKESLRNLILQVKVSVCIYGAHLYHF